MKKILKIMIAAILLTALVLLCACSGSKAKYGTLIYGNTDLSKYVTLGNYKGLSVDTSSENFKQAYENAVNKDISSNKIVEKRTEGKVANGDTANIDYEGKRDGVAFAGGTAKGYDLTIGSGSFIPGFESGLIGVNIGDTVDLNLTFPENYGNSELAGAAVVFTVKVNYVKLPGEVKMENHYADLGFSSFEEYEKDVKKRTASNLLFEQVLANTEVKEYPSEDKETLINAAYEYYDILYKKNNNTDFATILSQNNMTKEDFKEKMSVTADAQMKEQMVYYSIFRAEKLKDDYKLNDREKLGQDVMDEITRIEKAVKNYLYENSEIK
ncbi:MAG: FKBP-type peptidyl-prolyl cis-trans isomerase [Clostridia bacterium]|nr:FKBP-type peptidyl-prolyl cis-trans isomerase [Clostridia bacterium]